MADQLMFYPGGWPPVCTTGYLGGVINLVDCKSNCGGKIPHTDLNKIKRFRSWMAALTKNCVIDPLRKQARDSARLKKAAQDETALDLLNKQRSEKRPPLNLIQTVEGPHLDLSGSKYYIYRIETMNILEPLRLHSLDISHTPLQHLSELGGLHIDEL